MNVLHRRLIVAVSGRTGRSLWSYSIDWAFEVIRQWHWSGPAVVVVTRHTGATGKTRWVRPMNPATKADDGLDRILDVPDLNGDGTRDLIVVSRSRGRSSTTSGRPQPAQPERLFVAALSGKDGRPLWWWHVELPCDRLTRIWKQQLCGRGPDGWPIVTIALGG
jgi:hypothetical protein